MHSKIQKKILAPPSNPRRLLLLGSSSSSESSSDSSSDEAVDLDPAGLEACPDRVPRILIWYIVCGIGCMV